MLAYQFEQYFKTNWSTTTLQIDQLKTFAALILSENAKFNLTGHKTIEKIFKDLIIGAVAPFENLKTMLSASSNILDVGTGAGIPGMIIKILFPEKNIFLMESKNKKCQFIKKVIDELKLTNATILQQRAEDFNPHFKNYFDFITARALASIDTCLQWMVYYSKKSGKIVLPKSFHSYDEYNESLLTMKKLHLSLLKIEKSDSNNTMFDYHTYIFEKK